LHVIQILENEYPSVCSNIWQIDPLFHCIECMQALNDRNSFWNRF